MCTWLCKDFLVKLVMYFIFLKKKNLLSWQHYVPLGIVTFFWCGWWWWVEQGFYLFCRKEFDLTSLYFRKEKRKWLNGASNKCKWSFGGQNKKRTGEINWKGNCPERNPLFSLVLFGENKMFGEWEVKKRKQMTSTKKMKKRRAEIFVCFYGRKETRQGFWLDEFFLCGWSESPFWLIHTIRQTTQ